MNNHKTFVLGGSYIQLKSDKNMFTVRVLGYLHQQPATRSLKSSEAGADIALAGRPFQRLTVDGKKDPWYALIEQYNGRNR